jgi:N-[(2S)-2-amino-2-carboxyethyl]-L-glutamate dehydrogenase
MLYLSENELNRIGTDWGELIDVIEHANQAIESGSFAQPLKPYLRFNDLSNRIIAMPAYIGGQYQSAGMKWIASFPKNIQQGIKRAHSLTVLNDVNTGIPTCIINGSLISAIRTAAVTGVVIRKYMSLPGQENRIYDIGVVGLGPIGVQHLMMIFSLLPAQVRTVRVFDVKEILKESLPIDIQRKLVVCDDWQGVYRGSDIFLTCTTSKTGYINEPPPAGSLQLNISLRDYMPGVRSYMDIIIVDDWNEICREGTDIENMFLKGLLNVQDVISIIDVVRRQELNKRFTQGDVVMFNPMGMAVFDIAIAAYYKAKANSLNIGVLLPD